MPPPPVPFLRNRNVLLLFAANTISGFAQGITMLSIPWQLVQAGENGKAWNAYLIGFVTLASVLWGLYAGTLIDKHNRKHIFLGLNVAGFIALALGAAFGFAWGGVPIPVMCAVFACTAFIFNVHYPNLYAFVQELFDPSEYARANSSIEIQGQITNVLGMAAGAILLSGSASFHFLPNWAQLSPWRQEEIFLLNAATYLFALLLIAKIRYSPKPKNAKAKINVLLQVGEGFDFLRRNKALLRFGICSYIVFFTVMVVYQAVLPVYIKDVLQADAFVFGLSESAFAFGAIGAGWIGFQYNKKLAEWNIRLLIVGLSALVIVILLTLAFVGQVNVLIIGSVFYGLANALTRILRITFILKATPNEVVGRVNSFFQIVNGLMRAVFILLLALPFFSLPANGGNMVYALALLAAILGLAILGLFAPVPKFVQPVAKTAMSAARSGFKNLFR